MSALHEALLDKIKQLTPERIAQVENFVEFLRSRADTRRAGHAGRPSDSAQPSLKGRFQDRAKAPFSLREMDDAIPAGVVEAHHRISRRVKR